MAFLQESIKDAKRFTSLVDPAYAARFADAEGRVTDQAGLESYQETCFKQFVENHQLPIGDGKKNVVFFPSDLRGCGFVRCFLPARSIQKGSTRYNALISSTICPELIRWADIVVWQRQTGMAYVPGFNMARRAGKLQVYETDDNLHVLPPSNPAFRDFNPQKPEYVASLAWFQNCEGVIVSTKPLKQFYDSLLRVDCQVIENTIDIGPFLEQPPRPEFARVRILWAGSDTHLEDLLVVRPVLRRIKHEFDKGVKLLLMGFDGRLPVPLDPEAIPPEIRQHLRQDILFVDADIGVPYDQFLPWVDVEQYHQKLFDLGCAIGLCPLARNEFNRFKSNIKWLEYSAAGMATIATDIEPYRVGVENGRSGLLVENNEESWYGAIKRLIVDPAFRNRLVDGARVTIQKNFNADQVFVRYEQFFDSLLIKHGRLLP